MINRKAFMDRRICINEIAHNGAVHEILTKDGQVVRFFLKRGESMPEHYQRLYVENAAINIALVPKEQQEAMRKRAAEMANKLGIPVAL